MACSISANMRPDISSMTATMNIQLNIRLWNAKLIKKHIRHIGIKMLAGMQHNFFNAVGLLNCAGNNTGFNKLRPSADDGKDFFLLFSLIVFNGFFIDIQHGLYTYIPCILLCHMLLTCPPFGDEARG